MIKNVMLHFKMLPEAVVTNEVTLMFVSLPLRQPAAQLIQLLTCNVGHVGSVVAGGGSEAAERVAAPNAVAPRLTYSLHTRYGCTGTYMKKKVWFENT